MVLDYRIQFIRGLDILYKWKGGITDVIARIRIDSYSSIPIEKTLTFHNVVILIKSVVNKKKNNYYYNIFLQEGSNEDKSHTQYF